MSKGITEHRWTVIVSLDDAMRPTAPSFEYESDARQAVETLRADAGVARPGHRAWITLRAFMVRDDDKGRRSQPPSTVALWYWDGATWAQLVSAQPVVPPEQGEPKPVVLRQERLAVDTPR